MHVMTSKDKSPSKAYYNDFEPGAISAVIRMFLQTGQSNSLCVRKNS